jgi:hypothetical protein
LYLSALSLVQTGVGGEGGGQLLYHMGLGEAGLAVRLLARPTQVVLALLHKERNSFYIPEAYIMYII